MKFHIKWKAIAETIGIVAIVMSLLIARPVDKNLVDRVALLPDDNITTSLTEFATRYAAAWSSQDPEAFASFYAENGSLRINDNEPSIGRDAITETARGFMTAFPDMIVRLVEIRQTDKYIEFHWHWTGTNSGPGGTGNAVDLRGYEQWTLNDDGLILESLGHLDDAEYQRQLNAESPLG